MVNDIIDGISEKLNKTFGDDYEIYTEQVKQGLKEPCFLISCVNLSNRPFLGSRSLRTHLFSVEYFPKSESSFKSECLDVQDQLYITLNYIGFRGDLIRGTNMSGRIVDGVLVFTLNYDVFVRKVPEVDPMERIKITNKAKG